MKIGISQNIILPPSRKLGKSNSDLSSVYERLSDGLNLTGDKVDISEFSLGDTLKNSSNVSKKALVNINHGISLFTVAKDGVETLVNILDRIEELATLASDETVGLQKRTEYDTEARQLWDEFSRVSEGTKFNSQVLLKGAAASIKLQADVSPASTSVISGGIASVGGGIETVDYQTDPVYTGTGVLNTLANTALSSTTADGLQLVDVNSDGNLDAIVAGKSQVQILFGDGQGSFTMHQSFAGPTSISWAITSGDLNGDGYVDIVNVGQANPDNGEANIFLGSSDGTFTAYTSILTETYATHAVTLADVNEDGKLDLITSGFDDVGGGKVNVRFGDGSGGFGAATQYAAESTKSRSVVTGDINGDGILDLVSGGYGGGIDGIVTVRFGNGTAGVGDGTFGAAVSYSGDSKSTYSVQLKDLNGDGALDLITGGTSDANVATTIVRLNNGSGTFGASTQYTQSGQSNVSVKLADFNSDGNLDLVSAINTGGVNGGVSVRLGDGTGAFGARTDYTDGNQTNFLDVGDVNSDGVDDVVSVGITSGAAKLGVRTTATTTSGSETRSFSLLTVEDALGALDKVSEKREALEAQEGELAGFLSRLNEAYSYVESKTVRFEVAETRIRDEETAKKSSQNISSQILQNAGTAILAQANLNPATVLQLISGEDTSQSENKSNSSSEFNGP